MVPSCIKYFLLLQRVYTTCDGETEVCTGASSLIQRHQSTVLEKISNITDLLSESEDESAVQGDAPDSLSMGCSSGYVTATEVVPTVNGCGAESMNHATIMGSAHALSAACNFHDECYCRCTDPTNYGGKPFGQAECDYIFFKMMLEICHDKPRWRQPACRKTAQLFYWGLRKDGYHAFKGAVDLCCKCSANPSPVDPKWHYHLSEDMKKEEKAIAYTALRSDIESIVDDTEAFNNYLVPKEKSESGYDCLTRCATGHSSYSWCYTVPGSAEVWDYCSPTL